MRIFRRPIVPVALIALTLGSQAVAQPLSQDYGINFFLDVPSRNLTGLATRSDGRLVVGPYLYPLAGELTADLLWDLVELPDGGWLVATGPTGEIHELTINAETRTFTSQLWAQLDNGQVFKLAPLPDGRVVAGTSPEGKVYLLDRTGTVLVRAALPVDSVFDLLPLDDGSVLLATGNPGRIYRLDVAAWVAADTPDTEPADDALPIGFTEFGRVRDRNVRRLALATDGRILAGSAPDGMLYRFTATGGEPEVLFEDNRAEITDISVAANGDVYAAVVASGTPGTTRIIQTTNLNPDPDEDAGKEPEPVPMIISPNPPSTFSGRSSVLYLPGGDGLAETVVSRGDLAIYRLLEQTDGTLLIAGGEDGDLVGYDPRNRRSLTYGGSPSAQITDLAPLTKDGPVVALLNNPTGLALIDYQGDSPRQARTRRLDLREPGRIGAVRFNRLREVAEADLQISLRANRGSDEREGWTPWTQTVNDRGAWTAPGLLGRYAEMRIELPAAIAADGQLDNARIFHLPQNRRPVLQAFRILSPNFSLIERPQPNQPAVSTLGQVIGIPAPTANTTNNNNGNDNRTANALLASQVVPDPGMQIVTWTINDPDGDALLATFSIRRDDAATWTDLVVDSPEAWLQFDRRGFADGIYFTRLTVRETAPRIAADRFEITFEADDLVIDHTPPRITAATVEATPEGWRVQVTGEDALSILAGADFMFNNGYRLTVEQPADGIRDGQVETFAVDVTLARTGTATAVEIQLHDTTGNRAVARVMLAR